MSAAPSFQARRRAHQAQPAVTLQIDALVLRGVAPGDAATLAAALSDELSQLATQRAAFAPRQTEHWIAPPIAAGSPVETGRAVAAALWTGVRQQGSRP